MGIGLGHLPEVGMRDPGIERELLAPTNASVLLSYSVESGAASGRTMAWK